MCLAFNSLPVHVHRARGGGGRYRKQSYGVKVSNIPSTCSTSKLEELFRNYGQCDVRMGESSMKSRVETPHYYTYINFESLEDAQAAIRALNQYEVNGTRLSVKLQSSEAASVSLPQSAAPVTQTYTVKVTNIPKLVTTSDLTEMFSFSGSVNVASLKLNQTQTDVNFAYVNYTNSVDADQAVEVLNGSIVRGLKLIVKHGKGVSDTTATTSSSSSTSVKIVITEGSVDENELHEFFSQFGELRDIPKIRSGSPNFAYINYTNAADARKASQYASIQIKPGVTVKTRAPSDSPTSVTPAAPTVMKLRPKAPLCESKKIQCSAVIAQLLTSTDPKYVQYQQTIAPVTINREKNGSGIILFGANSSLPGAESLVRALITELEKEHAEKIIELPCMYIPAFCNQALVNRLSDIEQECFVRFLVCITPQCTQDLLSFSKMVSTKLASSVAVEISSLSITLHQKDSTDSVSKPACFVWSFKDDHHSYTPFDPVSTVKLNEHYSTSPQGSLQLHITTKLGRTQYLIDFATMRQTNISTGNVRKIKKSTDSQSLSPTWLYEGDAQKMVPYSASQCIEIERMYLLKKPADLIINSKIYTFDFVRMKQINKSSKYERTIERQSPVGVPTQDTFFKLHISGLQKNFKEAETKLIEELDNAVVKQPHPLPGNTDNAFQTELLQILHKYFVLSEIVGNNIRVQGVQGYIEKVTLILREKILEFEKEHLARAPATPHGVPVPISWEPQTDHFDTKELSRHGSEWKEIVDKIHKTLPSLQVASIKRIQNKWLWDRYSFAKQRMSERNAGVVNEQQLFHGTRTTPPEKIYKSEQGFDFRFSTKGLWGTGTYFAINASYSDRYCYQSSSGKQMILASVLTGETYRCQPDGSLKKPPIKPRKHGSFEDELYDSVSGHTNGSDVFIIYDHEKAYPSYLITYL